MQGPNDPIQAARHPAPRLTIVLRQQAFEPLELLAAWQRQLCTPPLLAAEQQPAELQASELQAPKSQPSEPCAAGLPAPAESHFIGRVRAVTAAGEPLEALELEHYPGMTDNQLETLTRECAQRHRVAAVLVVHRVGRILPGEAIVLVAIAADRRGQAQRCTQELLEALKHEAPFWKREWSGGKGTWVEGNTAF